MSTIEHYRFATRVTDPLKAQIEIRMEPTPYGDWCHAKDADALIGYLKDENAKLNAMRTPCPHCGADYLATGVEAGCPCRLKARVKELEKAFNLGTYIQAQNEWSLRTFGPGPRTLALIEHIQSELEEIRAKPDDLFEWIDLVILAFNGAWRAGFTPEQIVDALQVKQARNFNRKWPAPGPENKANFHIKEAEPLESDDGVQAREDPKC